MHVVVIHRGHEPTPENVQSLAAALGATTFDARQRLICHGPVVVSTQADPQRAFAILRQLQKSGLHAFVVDVDKALTKCPVFFVRSFKFEDDLIRVLDAEGRKGSISYHDIKLILPSSRTVLHTDFDTVVEKKVSVGKTLVTGGLTLTKKVKFEEKLPNEEREKILYLCGGKRARLVCGQEKMEYEGFSDEMKHSREMNFNLFISKIRQKCPAAIYDERLMKRIEQVKLLGPLLDPDSHIDLAADILATSVATRGVRKK